MINKTGRGQVVVCEMNVEHNSGTEEYSRRGSELRRRYFIQDGY